MEKKRILIIDDDVDLVERYKKVLEENGYKTDYAYDGKEGLSKLESKGADLVILDLQMPKMGGVDFLKNIRNNDKLKDTKVLVFSSYSYKDDRFRIADRKYKIKVFTGLGEKAYEEGIARGGYDGKFIIKSKEKLGENFEEYLLKKVKEAISQTPDPLERKKDPNEPDRVLIVDDDREMVEQIASWLKPYGYELIFAYNGAEALKILTKQDIDLVILDLNMPDTTGEDVLSVMHSIRAFLYTPVIVFTSLKDNTKYKGFLRKYKREIIDEQNLRSKIKRHNLNVRKEITKPKKEKSGLISFLGRDEKKELIEKVKEELEERRKIGYGYKKGPITVIRTRDGKWSKYYLEAFQKYELLHPEEKKYCCYCSELKKPHYYAGYPIVIGDNYLCEDCVELLKNKYPNAIK